MRPDTPDRTWRGGPGSTNNGRFADGTRLASNNRLHSDPMMPLRQSDWFSPALIRCAVCVECLASSRIIQPHPHLQSLGIPSVVECQSHGGSAGRGTVPTS